MSKTRKSSPVIVASPLEQIDRTIEDAVGRLMRGDAQPGDIGMISDLSARRMELTEPSVVARLEGLLGVSFPRSATNRVIHN